MSVGCIVSASSSVTECGITQSDGTLVPPPPRALLRSQAAGGAFLHFGRKDEGIITGRLKLKFTLICDILHGDVLTSSSLFWMNVLASPERRGLVAGEGARVGQDDVSVIRFHISIVCLG